jgi:hypothetical protein
MRVDRGQNRRWLDEALLRGRPEISVRRLQQILRRAGA